MEQVITTMRTIEVSRIKKIITSPWVICGVGALFYMYEYFLRISPGVMAESLRHAFHINATKLGILSAFYYVAYTPMQLPVGVLFDHYGPRRLLVLACLACVLGTLLFGISDMLGVSEVGRFLVGFGSAFAYVGVMKLATIWLPPERFALVAGLTSALGSLGAIFGESGMTILVDRIGWRATTFLSVGLGVVLAYVIWGIVRDRPRKYIHPRVGQAMDKILHPENKSFKDELGGMLLGLWGLIKNPQMWFVGAVGCLLYLPSSVFADQWAKPYFQARGFSSNAAALAVDMVYLGFMAGGPIMGAISDKIRRRRPPMFIGSVGAAILSCIIFYVPHLSHAMVYLLLIVFGIFYGGQPIVFAAGREIGPNRLSGTAVATTNMFVMLGVIFLQPLVGHLLDKHWFLSHGVMSHGIKVYSLADYNYALASLPVCLLASAVFALLIKETACRIKSI